MPTATEIKRFIISEFVPDVGEDQLDDDYDLLGTGVVGSLALLRLISWVGRRYGIPVEDMALSPEDFRSVNAIRAFVAGATSAPVPN
ncbi:acyl carrier protein [Allokutzneria oryzae]|uniref:Acyl carrier protein n=1 Tax=Allokutzneria oryzae TaxID=1378989 RepID=A0ABV6A712_9PSEU